MSVQEETVDIIIISTGQRAIGVDMNEIEKIIDAFDPDSRHHALLAGHGEKGTHLRLADFLRLAEPRKDNAAFIAKTGGTDRRLVTFNGTMKKKSMAISRIIPVTAFIRRKQNPFVVWGFGEEESRHTCMLITFQFMEGEGPS